MVLDLSWVLAGPYCTMLLRDLGAEVIKIERPEIGDILRLTAPYWDDYMGAYFMNVNRGKKSVTLNLASKRGREILLSLAKHADVIVENFVPGTAKKLGIDYPAIAKINPKVVYASISGFGRTGPYAKRPALDIVIQGMGGVMSITGEPGGRPVRVGINLADVVAGIFTSTAILAALQERQKSGLGQEIDMSMLETQVMLLEHATAYYWATGELPKPLGSRHATVAPFQAFETKNGYLVVAVINATPDPWPIFCGITGLVDLMDDPRFETPRLRAEHYQELEPILNKVMKTRTTEEWIEDFVAAGVPCGPVNSVDNVVSDPQLLHRGMVVEMPHPKLGTWKTINSPFRLSRTPGKVQGLAPELGEHTREVLVRYLGVTDDELKRLKAEGVV